jgi:hypothetical protein
MPKNDLALADTGANVITSNSSLEKFKLTSAYERLPACWVEAHEANRNAPISPKISFFMVLCFYTV